MKKGIVLLMCLCILLGMTACGGGETAGTAEATTAAETKPEPTVQVVEGQPVEQLDDVNVYIPVSGPSKELEGLPAYVYSEGAVVAQGDSQLAHLWLGQLDAVNVRLAGVLSHVTCHGV